MFVKGAIPLSMGAGISCIGISVGETGAMDDVLGGKL
jgi:hypothetical protein